MPICKHCNESHDPAWDICPACGKKTETELLCPRCQTRLLPHWVRCTVCKKEIEPGPFDQVSPVDDDHIIRDLVDEGSMPDQNKSESNVPFTKTLSSWKVAQFSQAVGTSLSCQIVHSLRMSVSQVAGHYLFVLIVPLILAVVPSLIIILAIKMNGMISNRNRTGDLHPNSVRKALMLSANFTGSVSHPDFQTQDTRG